MIILVKVLHILLIISLILACRYEVRKVAKKSMYSYRIVSTLGFMTFLHCALIIRLIKLYNYISSPEYNLPTLGATVAYDLTSGFISFVYIAFIPVLLFSVFLFISNIVLFCKEGRSLHNALGIASGAVFAFGSFVLINLYGWLDHIFNVHSYLGYHIELAIENILAIGIVYLECMMFATMYVAVKSMRHKATQDKEYVIVLGCRVREDGLPGGVLRERVEAAVKFANAQKRETQKSPVLVFSGGKGGDEPVSEAESMQRYVAAKNYDGIILLEDKSTTTFENFKYSKKLIKNTDKVAFATTDFHVFRSGVYATKQGFAHIEGIGSKSPWYFYYNALIREFVANMNSERRMHVFNLVAIIGVVCAVIVASYCFGIL
jgi:uncharacterized SAM-binding protein YcdF (DUF218 family)